MADSVNLPVAEGGRPSGGGKTNWPLIGAMAVGGVVLLILLMRSGGKGSGAGTTAAQTSINAALGSVEEENLNIMGEVSKAEQDLNNQIAATNQNVITGNQGIYNQTQADYWNIIAGQSLISGLLPGAPGGAAGQDQAAMDEYLSSGQYQGHVPVWPPAWLTLPFGTPAMSTGQPSGI